MPRRAEPAASAGTGFLSDEDSRRALERTAGTILACTRCRLHGSRTNAVPGEGPCPATILLVGEAPGRDEDASGRPFVGRAGRILDSALEAAGIHRETVFITNVVKCRPPRNRKPKRDEVATCRGYLMGQLACVRPVAIVTLGATALRGVLGPGHELKAVRGSRLRLGETPVIPTYHPAGVLYNRRLEEVLRKDLRDVAQVVGVTDSAPSTGKRTGRGRGARHSRRRRT